MARNGDPKDREAIKLPNGLSLTPDADGRITSRFTVGKGVLGQDVESRNDTLSQLLTGTDLLMDIGYDLVAVSGGKAVIDVSGDPSMVVDFLSDEEDPENPAPGP